MTRSPAVGHNALERSSLDHFIDCSISFAAVVVAKGGPEMETQQHQTSALRKPELSYAKAEERNNDSLIALNRFTVVRIAGAIAILLVLANIVAQCVRYLTGHESVYGLVPLFDLEGENNLPSFFSASLLLVAAVLLHIIARFKRKSRVHFASKWTILAWTFLYLAVDEAASIHELLIRPTNELLGDEVTSGIFSASWVIPGLAVTLLFAWSFLKFFLNLPRKIRWLFLLAASLYIGGALGMEMIGIRYFERHLFNLTYSMFVTVEESLEMAGAIVFVYALMAYIEANYPEVRFRFNGTAHVNSSGFDAQDYFERTDFRH